MNYSNFVFSLGIVYVLYYGSMIALDYYKAGKEGKSNKEGEDIDISGSIAQYKPLGAKEVVEHEESQNEIYKNENEEVDNDLPDNTPDDTTQNHGTGSMEENLYSINEGKEEEETVPLNIYGGMTLVDMQEIIRENSGENFFEDIIPVK